MTIQTVTPEEEQRELEELARRRKEDFEFMALCAAKNDMAMYELLRDRSLDEPKG
jgi:hypothetical protein